MQLGKSRAKNIDRCKAKVWTPTSTSEIDGTISQAAVSIFHCIPTVEQREATLKLLTEQVEQERKLEKFRLTREPGENGAWLILYLKDEHTTLRSPGLYTSTQQARQEVLLLIDDLATVLTWPTYEEKEQ